MRVFVLCGFRWARTPIRHHVILNNMHDAGPDSGRSLGTKKVLEDQCSPDQREAREEIVYLPKHPAFHKRCRQAPDDIMQSTTPDAPRASFAER